MGSSIGQNPTFSCQLRGGHPVKSSKPHELNYNVHFINWRKILYKTWDLPCLQLMLETSLYVKHGIGRTLIFIPLVLDIH